MGNNEKMDILKICIAQCAEKYRNSQNIHIGKLIEHWMEKLLKGKVIGNENDERRSSEVSGVRFDTGTIY